MIERRSEVLAVLDLLKRHPVVALLGVRQVGKTTLARQVAQRWKGLSHTFDLENPADLSRLSDPLLALGRLSGLVVIDEVQRRPDLFPLLRVLADRPRGKARFLVLGSASPSLLRQSSETLAGRIAYRELGGLAWSEVGIRHVDTLWLRGGMPRAFTAHSDADSHEWRSEFVKTFLERDLPGLGVRVASTTLQRFWTMVAHYHGQTWNSSEFARAFGVSDHAIRHYLDVLTASFVIRQLQPWHENISKRQVKAPKVYIQDSGILHTLLNLRTRPDLESHPKVGASWEGFILDQMVRHLGADSRECFFWGAHSGAELDLLVVRGRERLGFEFKRTTMPSITPSMRSACETLHLTRFDVIHAGDQTFPMSEQIRAVSVGRIPRDVERLHQ